MNCGLKAEQMVALYTLRELTCSGYFPVSALIDVYIVFQVDLYPAAVSFVIESDLLTRQR